MDFSVNLTDSMTPQPLEKWSPRETRERQNLSFIVKGPWKFYLLLDVSTEFLQGNSG